MNQCGEKKVFSIGTSDCELSSGIEFRLLLRGVHVICFVRVHVFVCLVTKTRCSHDHYACKLQVLMRVECLVSILYPVCVCVFSHSHFFTHFTFSSLFGNKIIKRWVTI